MPSEDQAAESLSVEDVVEWLATGEVGPTSEEVLAKLGPDLVRAGLRVTRIAAFVRTLHPDIIGRRVTWTRGTGAAGWDAPSQLLTVPAFQNNPPGAVIRLDRLCRWRLEGDAPLEYPVLDELRATGLTDYVGIPLHFVSGAVHAITYATDVPGGFTDAEVSGLARVTRPLARVAEVLALARTATNLLDAYVGHHAGARILAGHVRRGDTERIRCVIWFSDLRGFTTLSAEGDPESTIRLLNRLFDCQVPAVAKHGGEVLKFIGDGMLAIFRVGNEPDVPDVVRATILAAKEAFAALDTWNLERTAAGDAPLQFGLALHLGEVAYGNIGAAGRLDFTCIGAAVNLASRVEGVAGKLGKRLLLTDAVAKVAGARVRSLGAHALKGVEAPQEVYELVDAWSAPPPRA